MNNFSVFSCLRQLPVWLFALLLCLGWASVSSPAFAQDLAQAHVIVLGGPPTGVLIVPVGEEHSVGFSATVDHAPAVNQECTLNGEQWTWSTTGGNVDEDNTKPNVKFKFDEPGDYPITATATVTFSTSCSVDGSTHPGDSITLSGTGTVIVRAIRKEWKAAPKIGVVMDPDTLSQKLDEHGNPVFDGRFTSPQDQTKNPAVPDRVVLAPLKFLSCATEGATDADTWTIDLNGDGVISDDPEDGEKGFAYDTVTTTWTCTGGSFLMRDHDGHETYQTQVVSTDANFADWTGQWKAPAEPGDYQINAKFSDDPTPLVAPDHGDRDDGDDLNTSVTVTVFSSSIHFLSDKVAAGAVDNDAHKAAFEIKITDTQGNPLEGVHVVTPEIKDGGRGPKDRGNPGPEDDAITATAILDTDTTDEHGIATGTFRSGTRKEPTTLIMKINGDNSGPVSPAITQVWNELPEENRWDYQPEFFIGVPTQVSYFIAYNRGETSVSVPGHDVTFRATEIRGYEWIDDDEDGYDMDGDGVPDGYFEYNTYSEADAQAALNSPLPDADDPRLVGWNQWKGLSQFINPSSAGGTYSAYHLVNDGDLNEFGWSTFMVDYVGFNITDSSVRDAYVASPTP